MEIVKYLCEFFFVGTSGFGHFLMLLLLIYVAKPSFGDKYFNWPWGDEEESK